MSVPAALVLALLLLLGGCESVGYYTHIAGGQLKLLSDREPVAEVLDRLAAAPAGSADAALAERLRLSQAVLDYAETDLGLEVGGRYRSFVDLDRDAVVWNVFAAPPLALEPHTWCYPIAGCAPYRGYFEEARARAAAERLEADGLETYVGPVAAYSTLGWFDDPLLSSFIDMAEADFVELLIHELAHSRVWIRGDATFNESFATFVGREGARRWFAGQDREADFEAHLATERAWLAARRLLEATRDELAVVYGLEAPEAERRALKAAVLEATSGCLEAMAESTGRPGYRRLIERLNNAFLASLATYSDRIPVFTALFAEVEGDWSEFFAAVDLLVALDGDARAARMEALAPAGKSGEQQVAAHGDDTGADEIQCEALAGHGLDGEATGAEHDDVRGGGDR